MISSKIRGFGNDTDNDTVIVSGNGSAIVLMANYINNM